MNDHQLSPSPRSKSGFTLVELSIVLVIIGLLIGGVLVGQSLIGSSKISSQVKQLQQFDIALATFEDRYRGLPGDSNKLGGTGNNDGRIGETAMAGGEQTLFWNHLSLTGLKTHNGAGSVYSSSGANGVVIEGANANAPKAILGKNISIIPQFNPGYFVDYPRAAHYYTFADCSDITAPGGHFGTHCGSFVIKGADVIALDSKIDDGKGISGSVLVSELGDDFLNIWSNDPVFFTDVMPAEADINLFVRMGLTTGNPK